MKIASSSGSPTERSSCCWVPSPQSNRMRSPPARSSSAGRPRRAVGTEPAVPAKKSERSMAAPRLERAAARSAGARPRRSRSPSCASGARAALGRRAGVEDLEAVARPLVQRQVRVAEDHRVGVLEARRACARAAPCAARRRGSSRSARRPARPRGRSAASAAAPRRRRCRGSPWTGGPSRLEHPQHLDAHEVAGVQDRVGGAQLGHAARRAARACRAACGCRR